MTTTDVTAVLTNLIDQIETRDTVVIAVAVAAKAMESPGKDRTTPPTH